MSPDDVEVQRRRCARPAGAPPVRTAGDIKTRFEGLLAGKTFQEFGPQVLSVDPLIVYFDTFMTEEEVVRCEAQIDALTFAKSRAGYGGKHTGRQSDTAFCLEKCASSDIVQTVQKRASSISGVPIDNMDWMQALRYREGMYFTAHHDNHPTFHLLPCGTRIFSFFVYLSDKGLEGGATNFPRVNVSVPAKRGAAVLFANTRDDDPSRTDERSLHEGVEVTKGEKRGLNLWLYQYNYKHFWQMGCTTIELADNLGKVGKAAVEDDNSEGGVAAVTRRRAPARPRVIFENTGKSGLRIFWKSDDGQEMLVEQAGPGESKSIDSFPGHVFLLRTADGKLVLEHVTSSEPAQSVQASDTEVANEL